MTTHGGCLCGSVRYEIEGEPLATAICHCPDCQKQTGTSFSIVLGVAADALRVRGETAVYATRGVTGQAVHRHFCGKCGSPIYSVVDAIPGLHYVKAGTLDEPGTLQPQFALWCSTAQPWLKLDPPLPEFAQNPPLG